MFQVFISISAILLSETLKKNRAIEVECVPSVREGPKLKVNESAGPKPTVQTGNIRSGGAVYRGERVRLVLLIYLFGVFFCPSRFTDSVPESWWYAAFFYMKYLPATYVFPDLALDL